MPASRTVQCLNEWAASAVAGKFPYAAAMEEIRSKGKHFIDGTVLEALKFARRRAAARKEPLATGQLVASFLDTALDKADGTFNYLSYIALPVLAHGVPELADRADPREAARPGLPHDRALVSIMADLLHFELNQLEGRHSYLHAQIPPGDLIQRRLVHAFGAIKPALLRLGFLEPADSIPLAERIERIIEFSRGPAHVPVPNLLDLAMMPVYVVHDEYLFIRILQAMEVHFACVAAQLRLALQGMDESPHTVPSILAAADKILQEGLRHFRTLSTMQRASFSTFREFTTGASAIQSVNYKLVESLCRTPAHERLESIAYASVPAVQRQLRIGTRTLDARFAELREQGLAEAAVLRSIEAGMQALSGTLLRWRHSHHAIARKYLPEGTGTGYTEGTPYLGRTKDIAVFPSIPANPPA